MEHDEYDDDGTWIQLIAAETVLVLWMSSQNYQTVAHIFRQKMTRYEYLYNWLIGLVFATATAERGIPDWISESDKMVLGFPLGNS